MTATSESATATPLTSEELQLLDAYWRAANYLSVGQVYLLDNPLLREPLRREYIKPRLLGHFGTTPGLNLIYVHLNRAIGSGIWTRSTSTRPRARARRSSQTPTSRRTYSEHYPDVSPRMSPASGSSSGSSRSRGGIPKPGSEVPARSARGGELGYALVHAFGAFHDNPTSSWPASWGTARPRPRPLAASWHSNKFLSPRSDGAVLPILHLNGYKIANPTVCTHRG